jgi:hypothetical protein
VKAKDLIEKLQGLPPETEILVWAGENSQFPTSGFGLEDAIYVGSEGAVILE